eukprot:scaffold13825_cov60-Phaeocystis_antarctica.AAC.7
MVASLLTRPREKSVSNATWDAQGRTLDRCTGSQARVFRARARVRVRVRDWVRARVRARVRAIVRFVRGHLVAVEEP